MVKVTLVWLIHKPSVLYIGTFRASGPNRRTGTYGIPSSTANKNNYFEFCRWHSACNTFMYYQNSTIKQLIKTESLWKCSHPSVLVRDLSLYWWHQLALLIWHSTDGEERVWFLVPAAVIVYFVMRESSQTQLHQNRWYILKLEQKTTCFGRKWPSSGFLQNTWELN
jgi:hypothetical protein